MELNRNKMIFLVVGIIILISFLFLLFMLSGNNDKAKDNNEENNIRVWVVGENFNYSEYTNSFKELYKQYKNKSVVFEFFSDYEDYYDTLASAIISGVGPDIFVLNNNEANPIFAQQVMGVNPTKVNPNDFRKTYKEFFGKDLIETYEEDGVKKEILAGIPYGYETLGVYYNRKYVKNADLKNIMSMNNIIAKLKDTHGDIIPLGIGNGSSVYDVSDIITQFFMLSGVDSIAKLNGNPLKEGIISYLGYGDVSGINGYNSRLQELKSIKGNSIVPFVKGEIFMLIGYPSMINRITEAGGFSKNFLEVAPFPHYVGGKSSTLVNYNYFVINKDTKNMDFAQDYLTYLTTDNGATIFLNNYPYYLPGLVSLEESMFNTKIDQNYNISRGDFLNNDFELSSFDKGIKTVYDREIKQLLDNPVFQENQYTSWVNGLLCKLNKVTNFTGLSTKCD